MCPTFSYKIYSGSHIFFNGGVRFISSFKDTAAPTEAAIYINGVKSIMTLDLGTTSMS
jgi:hypothetical protein